MAPRVDVLFARFLSANQPSNHISPLVMCPASGRGEGLCSLVNNLLSVHQVGLCRDFSRPEGGCFWSVKYTDLATGGEGRSAFRVSLSRTALFFARFEGNFYLRCEIFCVEKILECWHKRKVMIMSKIVI